METKRIRLLTTLFVLLLGSGYPVARRLSAQSPNLRPQAGYVSDVITATKIADAVLVSMFREEYVNAERPLSVVLKGDAWVVRGKTFDEPHPGGSVDIKLNKQSACVLSVTGGK